MSTVTTTTTTTREDEWEPETWRKKEILRAGMKTKEKWALGFKPTYELSVEDGYDGTKKDWVNKINDLCNEIAKNMNRSPGTLTGGWRHLLTAELRAEEAVTQETRRDPLEPDNPAYYAYSAYKELHKNKSREEILLHQLDMHWVMADMHEKMLQMAGNIADLQRRADV